jgi:MFS family permease
MNYKKRLEKNIKLGYIISFTSSLIFVIPVWVAFYTRILNFTQLALLTALELGATLVLELPTGALADLIGRRKTIILGWLITGISNVYIGFSSSLLSFTFGFIGRGIGASLISGADTALIFDSLKELGKQDFYSRYAARAGFVYRGGLVIATFLGGYLYRVWIGLPYVSTGLMQVLTIFLVFLMIEPRIDSEKFSLSSYISQTKIGFSQIFKSDYLKKLSFYYVFLGGITWSCLTHFNLPFAVDFAFSEVQLSWVFSLLYLFNSLILFLVTEKEDVLLTRKRVYLGLPLIMVLSFLPGFFVSQKWLAPLMILGIMFAGSSRFAILDRYTNKEFLSKYRATAISALNMLISLFYIVLVSMAGPIQDKFNTKLIYTLLGAATLIFVLPAGVSLVKEHNKYHRNKNKKLAFTAKKTVS